ncbi:glycosyltransferase [Cellulomonas sp. C5510]|uniref:glycosyltransferase n=1 Tax=Cellulomonas sp. C5510 TaxID=2871170 RepID=UPI001C957C27|nr:glycosyltransferase [Cellulomonas sp. C5510]QZN86335.1 glycosyltransferase [Cellulomonas sp. C5510]
MRIALIVQHPVLPEVTAGGILDLHHLARELVRAGHAPEVVATKYGGRRLLPRRALQRLRPRHPAAWADDAQGYRTTRYGPWALRAGVEQRLDDGDWDVVALQDVATFDLVEPVHRRGIPLLIRIVAMQEVDELARRSATDPVFAAVLRDPRVRVVSNSRYVAGQVRDALGLDTPVVYPPVDLGDCRATGHDPVHVTMVNPRDVKGIDTTLAVAALLPHRQFLLQEAWALDPDERDVLLGRLRALPNVRLAPVTDRMAEVYRRTAVLLAPSRVVETFGRVALEAAANGIPVVATRAGGLPEAVGPGGVLVEPDAAPQTWAGAVEELLADPARYARVAAAGRAHAAQQAFDQSAVAAAILRVALSASGGTTLAA